MTELVADRGVGVDIGGTFTDVALESRGKLHTCKLLTNQSDPARAVMEGIYRTTDAAGLSPADLSRIIHGTTLVTNALIERRGARTAFITTEGFRDVIEMRSENRFEQYDLNLQLPEPLVPREHRFPAAERISADGSVLLELADSEIERLLELISGGRFESVAVGFLHAYANNVHEQRMASALCRAFPTLPVSLSSVVSPQMRELSRFNTVTVNAYVQPKVAAYLRNLATMVRDAGCRAPLFLFHSGGGLIDIETAIQQPVRLLESGPAGGAIFASGFARSHSIDKAVSLDMGGTTAKICLVEDGAPKTASTFEIARSHMYKKGSGLTVSTPVIEMIEIGAGGGSIASRDSLGRILVGPRSAGSEPGPACYCRGGTSPTVTDANLLLGRIDPCNFAGGSIQLDSQLSRQSIESALGQEEPCSDLAFAITELVDENMANATRVHAIENGRDIEQFSMIAFGGGAPLHACRLCEKLGIDRLIIPPGAGVGSAIGFLRAPFSYEATRGLFQSLDSLRHGEVNAMIEDMREEARKFVQSGAGDMETFALLTAFMRYSGQGWEIPVQLPFSNVGTDSAEELKLEFERAYAELFGRTIEGLAIEITNWSLIVSTAVPQARSLGPSPRELSEESGCTRDFFDAALRKDVKAAEVPRTAMIPGRVVAGPAIIVENETSTIVTSAYLAVGQSDGSILVTRKANQG